MSNYKKNLVLCILDGWGHSNISKGNAIALSNTPVFDKLSRKNYTTLSASGKDVGLPEKQMGNSEVGHMSIGSGRLVMQDLERINATIKNKTLHDLSSVTSLINKTKSKGGNLHIAGLLSDGGVHSHLNHITALIKIAQQQNIKIYLHAFLDGRDTSPKSAKKYINHLISKIQDKNIIFATVSGRYYAMDRDNRWDRTKLTYEVMVNAKGPRFRTIKDCIKSGYQEEIFDEFICPAVIGNYKGLNSADSILFANFRADRMRQITTAIFDPAFNSFYRKNFFLLNSSNSMTSYSSHLDNFIEPLFKKEKIKGTLGEAISNAGLKQFRIAETEKYAHITFFLNGGKEIAYKGEKRVLVSSPDVPTYNLQPEMSAYKVTKHLIRAINTQKYQLLIVNFANPDMVGHTGDAEATIKAIETVDNCLDSIYKSVRETNGHLMITSDHGNAEKMLDEDNLTPFTAHTSNLVPFILVSGNKKYKLKTGTLSDIAPTILSLMNIETPKQMTGTSLIKNT